ncbi:MAG: nitroreductase family deazaflavin-dependent oxidoreductase [Acidimicrobiaceae bacterium]|jgi:deazaflavin-dependent oxidoreductase (nitroreductase family)|nr:nitroreductase family deazaflavin-dependent oxidoreductase [Acidimicrobiaceae bacterium]
MPSDFGFKTLNTIHRTIQTVSGGRLGWSLAKMLVVELTTTGRKSGQPRSVMLTSPHQDGDTIVLIASRAGDDHHPAWLLNLRDNPSVIVGTKDGTTPMTARIADEAERAELWPKITAVYKGYDGYQHKTNRLIPVVLLEPVS